MMNNCVIVQLFDFLAECIAKFVKDQGLSGRFLPLGFTFSFPCRQEGLAVGRLIHWSKGFQCSGVEGKDVVKLLQDAICRRRVNYYAASLFLCRKSEQGRTSYLVSMQASHFCWGPPSLFPSSPLPPSSPLISPLSFLFPPLSPPLHFRHLP